MQTDTVKAASIMDLRRIPGVGPSISEDLWDLGYRSVEDLKGQDPQAMYETHCVQRGMPVDRCLLYVFRCAVYFAETPEPDPDRLMWWVWKD